LEVMKLLAEQHMLQHGDTLEMLKVPKKQMPLYVLALRFNRVMTSKISRARSDCFKALQEATCLPNVEG
jgi:hypothetical protein